MSVEVESDLDNFIKHNKALAVDYDELYDYTCDKPPTNGNQYLYKAIQEASRFPDTIIACASDVAKFTTKQNVTFQNECLPETNTELKADKHWQELQINDVKRLVKIIENKRKLFLESDSTILTPNNNMEWYKFIFIDNEPPLLSYLFKLNQLGLEGLLKNFTIWLKENSTNWNRQSTLWLYSILMCMNTPLHPSSCSVLREISRLCWQKRAKINDTEDELLMPINLLICIIARHFRQLDLGDN